MEQNVLGYRIRRCSEALHVVEHFLMDVADAGFKGWNNTTGKNYLAIVETIRPELKRISHEVDVLTGNE